MKFSELNKEQKQLLVLGVGGIFTLLMVFSNLLIKPATSAAKNAEEIIDELGSEVNRGELLIQRDARVRADVSRNAKAVFEIVKRELPPETGRYGWALESLTDVSDMVGVMFSVKEHLGARYVPLKPGENFNPDSVSMWIPYAVEVDFQCSFENLKIILDLLEEKFPYCSVANMQIRALKSNPESHQVSLILEWPVFRFVEDLNWIQSQAVDPLK